MPLQKRCNRMTADQFDVAALHNAAVRNPGATPEEINAESNRIRDLSRLLAAHFAACVACYRGAGSATPTESATLYEEMGRAYRAVLDHINKPQEGGE